MKTIRELEDELLVMQSATHPKTGERLAVSDHKYKMECWRRQVELSDRRMAEGKLPPRISSTQLAAMNGSAPNPHAIVNRADLELLAKAQGVKNPKTGRRYAEENPVVAQNIQKARVQVFEGKPLSAALVANTQKFIEQK
jgi:hypothetical protein